MQIIKNIRVYGIFLKNENLLVCDEIHYGRKMTKFPGGGLERGEGTIDALIRECQEEMGLTPTNIEHFYTTDFYQETQMIDPPQQLISIYYSINLTNIHKLPILNKAFDFEEKEGAQGFRFTSLKDLDPQQFTFPIDKKVATLLIERFVKYHK